MHIPERIAAHQSFETGIHSLFVWIEEEEEQEDLVGTQGFVGGWRLSSRM